MENKLVKYYSVTYIIGEKFETKMQAGSSIFSVITRMENQIQPLKTGRKFEVISITLISEEIH